MKMIFFLCCLYESFIFADIPDLIPAPLSPPIRIQPTKSVEVKLQKRILYFSSKSKLTYRDWYELSLLYIRAEKLEEAKDCLSQAVSLRPKLYKAYIQLGFIYFWENNLSEAYVFFFRAMQESPCEKSALYGLEKIANSWSKHKKTQSQAIDLYRELIQCQPDNSDYFYYIGRVLAYAHRWDEAKEVLEESIRLSSHNLDAEMELARIYIWEKNWVAAEEIYRRYPDNPEAEEGLAKIAIYKNERVKACEIYSKILEKKPDDFEIRRQLAKLQVADQRYKKAKEQYRELLKVHPGNGELWKEAFDVKAHTNPAMLMESTYTDAKENDPTLGVPVVKDYYFFSAIHFFIPIFDRWRLDAKGIYYHQRENNILNPSVNYSAFLSGGQLVSHYYFSPDSRWDVIVRGFKAWGIQQSLFPFINTIRFEPGTNLIYNKGVNRLFLDVHVESFIIKNFAIQRSEILRKTYIEGAYDYNRSDVYLRPQFGGGLHEVFYKDHNRKDVQFVRAQSDFFVRWLTLNYVFTHSHFKFLTSNYFSYKGQILHTLGVKLHTDIHSRVHFEVLWEHKWQSTKDLIEPIGNFIFVASEQYIIGNLISSRLQYLYKDTLKLEIGGHYDRTTLIYRDWNLHGSILWQF